MTTPPSTRGTVRPGSRRSWAGWLLVAYLAPLTVLVFTAQLSDTGLPQLVESLLRRADDLGILGGLRFGHVEALANVLVFVPIGFLVTGLLGRRSGAPRPLGPGLPDWGVWLAATMLSAGIELAQHVLLTERSATLRDLACNAAGALAGVLAYRIIDVVRRGRREESSCPATTPGSTLRESSST